MHDSIKIRVDLRDSAADELPLAKDIAVFVLTLQRRNCETSALH